MTKVKLAKKRAPYGKKKEAVWRYLLEHRLASAYEVSAATGVSLSYAYLLMSKIGTPREVFEAEAEAEAEADVGVANREEQQDEAIPVEVEHFVRQVNPVGSIIVPAVVAAVVGVAIRVYM